MKLKETWTVLAIILLRLVLVISLPIGEEENEISSNSTDLQHEFDKWTEEEGSLDLEAPESKEEQRDEEEVECDTPPDSFDPFRNGLSDDSYSVWADKKIPYVIGEGFNETAVDNIKEAINNYNVIFENCITWVPRSSEAVYVEFLNSGSCYSKIGRAYWPFPVPQSIYIGKCSHLVGHIKHEMMHTLGFYHEHSRSDRDMYVDIMWSNILEGKSDQFQTYRWTTGYGEKYDYDSIMHYTKTAFSKTETDMTIVPKYTDPDVIGKKVNLSETDIVKIKKLYKCSPYNEWENGCDKDEECGFNEYCTTLLAGYVSGQCRTRLANGSLCVRSQECLNTCSGGVCSSCTEDSQCPDGQYCANKYLPFAQNICSSYCGELCLLSSQCGGTCTSCSWSFTCK